MYRIVLTCSGVAIDEGAEAASDLTNEFWGTQSLAQECQLPMGWGQLTLQAENDFDSQGLALQDEFADCPSAYIVKPFEGQIRILSIVKAGGT